MKTIWNIAVGVCLALSLALPLAGATRYVDSTAGNCAGNYSIASRNCTGSDGTSYATIASGVSNTVAGDTLYIRAGTYVECIDNAINNGSVGSPILISRYQSESVILRPTSCGSGRVLNMNNASRQYITIDGLILDAVNLNSDAIQIHGSVPPATGINVDHITLSNITTRNHYKSNGVNFGPNANFMTLQNSAIEGHGSRTCTGDNQEGHGLYLVGSDSKITGNTIDDVCGFGIHVYSGYAGHTPSRNIITKNIVSDFGRGQTVLPSGSRGIIAYGDGNLVANNLVFRGPMGLGANGTENKFYNNTVYATNQSSGNIGIWIAGGSGHLIRNNIIRISATHLANDGSGLICSNNIGLTSCANSAEVDPLFTDPANGNFALTAGSPAIDAGTNLSPDVTDDFAGVSRPQGLAYDIGGLEKTDAAGDTLTLLTPNSGTLGVTGSSQTITWGSTGTIANLRIREDAAYDGTFDATATLAASTPNDGSFSFTAGAAGTTYRFEVCDAADNNPCDISDSNVTITASAGGSLTKIISENTTGTKVGDITGVSDVWIAEGAPTTNYGTHDSLYINKFASGDHNHGLVKFDGISQIPSNATLSSVTFGIYLYNSAGAAAQTFDIRKLLRDWNVGQATWNVYTTGNSWTTAGAEGAATDRVSTEVAQISGVDQTSQFWTVTQGSGGLFDLVQGWINLTVPNYGVHLERNGTGNDATYRAFSSSNGTNGQRPYLEATYSVTAASLTVTQPTGTGHFFPGQAMPVRWTSAGISGNVVATISRNNGTSYETALASRPFDQPDGVWEVSGPACTQCKIKVCDLTTGLVCGESPAFKIAGLGLFIR